MGVGVEIQGTNSFYAYSQGAILHSREEVSSLYSAADHARRQAGFSSIN